MFNSIRNHLPAFISIFAVAILLSLTDFYSIGYVLAIIPAAYLSHGLFVFKSFMQRYVLYLLTFTALIMITGLVCWLLQTPLLPLYNILVFMLFSMFLLLPLRRRRQPASKLFIDRVDFIGIIVALVPILVIAMSYLSSPNLSASLFQLAGEGWDNGPHIRMMTDISHAQGYVYGQKTTSDSPNTYPMAWHLASADLANGFGGNRFVPSQPMTTILTYMIVSISWLMIASYVFMIVLCRLYEKIAKKSVQKLTETIPLIAFASIASIVVLIAALMHGFTNFIGSITFLILLTAIVIEVQKIDDTKKYILAILFGTVSVMTWFLTIPAIGLLLLSILLTRHSTVKDSFVAVIKDRRLIVATVIGLAVMTFQVLIFITLSALDNSGGQLTVGSRITPFDLTGSPLHISTILFGTILTSLFFYILHKSGDKNIQKIIFISTLPWVFLVLFVYLYQNITVGYNSYYLTKVMGMCLVASLIPVGAYTTLHLNKLKPVNRRVTVPIVAILGVGILFLASGQPLYGVNKLFQRNARTTFQTSEQIVKTLPKTVDGSSYIVVFTNRKNYEGTREDYHGKLEINVLNKRLDCVYYITNYYSRTKTAERLAACADEPSMKDKTIYVITSSATYQRVEDLQRPNIVILPT